MCVRLSEVVLCSQHSLRILFDFFGWVGREAISSMCQPADTPLWQFASSLSGMSCPTSCWTLTSVVLKFTDAYEHTHPGKCLSTFNKVGVPSEGQFND